MGLNIYLLKRVLLFGVAVLLSGGSAQWVVFGKVGPEEVSEVGAGQASHQRMLDALKEISVEASRSHPYLSEVKVGKLRERIAELDDSATPETRHRLYMEAGVAELEIGEVLAAIEAFERAYLLLLSAKLDERKRTMTRFQLAAAYLRLGEVENCCLRHDPESCILPIRGGGLHQNQEGSRRAIQYFTEALEEGGRWDFFYFASRWLLNIAYMTIDEHPVGVPRDYLIPAAAFESELAFPRFRNVAPQLGLGTYNLAGGAIVDDFDGDHYLDVVTSTWDPGGQIRFFRNDRKGSFVDQTEEAGLEGLYGGLNLVQADYNNDGHLDVLVLRGAWLGENGQHPNSLLRNNGNGTFTDVTFDAGLGDAHYPTQTASWADYDNDGNLDLYIGNEYKLGKAVYGGTTFNGIAAPCQLFRNRGDGTFEETTRKAGVENMGFSKGVSWGDYDGDRYPDLYVSNYSGNNRLYRNNGDGTFKDVAPVLGLSDPQMSFPCWFWDYDNDGILDLYVASYTGHVAAVGAKFMGVSPSFEMPRLYRGDGRGGFQDVAEDKNLKDPILPMGSNFGDLNNDGFLDFYLGTGDPNYWSLMPNVLYLNQDGKRFEDVTMASGLGHLQKGHGVAFADLDSDGDLDIFEQMGGAYRGDQYSDSLFENPGFGNNSIGIELVGVESNRSAIGARIHALVEVEGRLRSIFRTVSSGGSFGSNPLRQTIGVETADILLSLEVFWPTTGKTQVFKDVSARQVIRVTEGEDGYEPLEIETSTWR